jgi:hypothetical protein
VGPRAGLGKLYYDPTYYHIYQTIRNTHYFGGPIFVKQYFIAYTYNSTSPILVKKISTAKENGNDT